MVSTYSSVSYNTYDAPHFARTVKVAEFNPIGTFNQNLSSGDSVRFNIAANEYWDPYSAFIDITIDFKDNNSLNDDAVFTNKIVQLDSSAQSLFSSLTIYEDNEILEFIKDYDVLACMLKDMSYDVSTRFERDYEGLGGAYYNSTHNAVGMAALKPYNNTGVMEPIKGWQPHRNQEMFNNNAGDIYANGNTNTAYTTRNMMACANQTGFQPLANWGGTTHDASIAGDIKRNFTESDLTQRNCDPFADGLINPFNPALAAAGMEPMFSKTVPQRYLKNGFNRTEKVTSMTFTIPLMSGIFGHLMTTNNYKLIPLKYFKELVFEFTFNPHAFFTSWSSTDTSSKNYQVKKFVIRNDMVQIDDPNLEAQIQEQYRAGIKIQSHSFTSGPNYPIINGLVPPTLQVNLGFESLRNIFTVFIPNDYTANTSCRKNYRLSMGITNLQVKIGTEYYPQLGIRGNGGNNLGVNNNNQFIQSLWKAFGKHINPAHSVINPHNFAINCRAYDPFLPDPLFTQNTCLQFFEENRVIGKAIYAIPLDLVNYSNSILSGRNTTKERPFEINFQYDSSKVFNRSVNMMTFFHHDIALHIREGEPIRTIGRG